MAAGVASGADDTRKGRKPVAHGFVAKHDVSAPLWMIKNPAPVAAKPRQVPIQRPDFLKKRARPAPLSRDPLLGRRIPLPFLGPMPNPIITFEGTSDDDNQAVVGGRVVPPDTNGDVGLDHYVQWNNLVFEVFNKDGSTALGPLAGNSLFSGFGGPCETNNDGDPIVLYDRLADRWLLSQFSINEGTQRIAISQTGDPTGAYHRYAFVVTPGAANDYPKFGIWPTATNSAYLATFRKFGPFAITATAFERDKMLAGDPAAQFVNFDLNAPAGGGCTGSGDCYEGALPSHAIGSTPPPDGPGYLVMSFDDEAFSTVVDGTKDSYKIWEILPDWTTPASSTLTGPTSIDAPEMDINLCNFNACVPQQGGELLDHLSFFTMNRAVYRNFGDHEAIFVNNTVDLGSDRAGIRWAELRDPNGAPSLFQTGTHGPDDGLHRWMGSLAVDASGNVALGYSTSGTSLFPSIRYAGRLAGDPLGTLAQTENELHAGTGSQTASFSRWGDYSSMSVDPVDDCTFWYTTEYYVSTGSFDFHTRIGSFKFPSCIVGPHGTLNGSVTNSSNGNPISGASIQLGIYSTTKDASGAYSLNVAPNTYDVTASAYGFAPQTVNGVVINDGDVITQNFALAPLPTVTVDGVVTDGSGAGWPLYARVKITPSNGPITTVYTNGNLTGGSSLFAEINSDECGLDDGTAALDSDLVSPLLDLSGVSGAQRLLISFNSDYRDLCSGSSNAVSLDVWNGSSWAQVFDFCGTSRRGPRVETFSTQAANGVANAQVRFHYVADWDWWWQVDNVNLAVASCQFGGGGIVLGNVTDANTSAALNGASVSLDTGESTTTAPTPADTGNSDGFYLLYSPPGSRTLTVSKAHYATQNIPITVPGGSVQRQDVALAAGKLAATPSEIRKRVKVGNTATPTSTITLDNSGGAAAAFKFVEIDATAPAAARPAKPSKAKPQKLPFDPKTKQGYLASIARTSRDLPAGRPLVKAASLPIVPRAGEAVSEFATGLNVSWGAGFNTDASDVWVSSLFIPFAANGDGKDHRFTTTGTDTGDTIDFNVVSGAWPGDMTYNIRTGMLWQVAVGGDNCLHELDPVAKVVTGNTICPDVGTSMRGVAYNPGSDTYYVGSWNGTFVAEVDPSGAVLRQKNVGLAVSGLAINPRTGHLFVQVNAAPQLVWVLDVNDDFAFKSAFALAGAGGPAFADFEGAGLEMDCSGNLWSVNQISEKVFVNKSGETNTCISNIPWLSEAPDSGSVAANSSTNSTATFTSTGTPTGCYEGQLLVRNDTPYGTPSLAAGLTVAFKDVQATTKSDKYIHAIAGAHITHGCGQGRFCPSSALTRGTASVWLLRSRFGIGYAPPPATGIFVDVSPESFGADYIEDAYNRGIFTQCNISGAPRFCPNQPVTRKLLASLLLKTSQGSSYTPPACTGIFKDVKCTEPYAPWVKDVYNRGWMDACMVKPNLKLFCPTRVEQRGLSAEEDAKTFGIPACKQ